MAYITRQQAADIMGIGLRTLDGLIARGQLPAYRVGPKLVRLREDDVDNYVQGRAVPTQQSARQRRTPAQIEHVCQYVPGMKVV